MARLAVLVAILCAVVGGPRAAAQDSKRIAVGYFQQLPTPSQFAQDKKTFDSVLGIEVDWIAFDDSSDMRDALASGQIQIGYALGMVPFLVGVSNGLDLTMVGVALAYPDFDNCIVGSASGIDRNSARELEGSKVALQIGSVSHYRMLEVLKYLQVDASRLEILAVSDGSEAAAALRRGEVKMACASGSALAAMAELGQPLLDAETKEQLGLKLFDSVVVASDYMNENPYVVQSFMDVVEASNQQWRVNPEPMRAAIARAAAMDREAAGRALDGFWFPTAKAQKSDAWLGGGVQTQSKKMADFFAANGRLIKALDSYTAFISTRFLR